MSKVKYDSVAVDLCQKKDGTALDVDKAKELIGWLEERAGEFAKEFLFRDYEGTKVRLANNPSNRPFRMTLAKRYANEMLRGKWQLNGESIVLDRIGNVQSGQHRLVAFILAEQMRKANPEKWKPYGVRGPLTLDCLLVYGISEKAEVVDTLDLGQKRSLGDVVYRNHEFGRNVSDKEQKRLSNVLAGATRLVWLRAGGKTVSDAPHFPHSEALDFIKDHSRLNDAVKFVWDEDGGTGADGKKISTYLSLGYAAGLLYLMGTAATDPDKFHAEGPEAIDFKLWEKACEFWVEFGSGTNETISTLQRLLVRSNASGAGERDEIVGMVIKAFNAWITGDKVSAADLKVKRTKDKETDKMVLAEDPRLGGLDVVIEVAEEPEEAEAAEEKPEEKPTPAKKKGAKKKGRKPKTEKEAPAELPKASAGSHKGSKAGEAWTAGDKGWVKDDDGDHWFGTIKSLSEDGKIAFLVTEEAPDKEWEASVDDLSVTKPKGKKAA